MIDLGKDIKRASKRKWTDREYHVQDIKYFPHIAMKMVYATTQFPALPFFVRMQNTME